MNIVQMPISNNYTAGRKVGAKTYKIKRIVLHTVAGKSTGQGIHDWFDKASTQASAHYYVHSDGSIYQYVQDEDVAWHAGTVKQPNNNWESVGIEFWDNGEWSGSKGKKRTDALYAAGSELIASLCKKHGVKCELLSKNDAWGNGIGKHNYYAAKACPGDLDCERFIEGANEILAAPTTPPDTSDTCKAEREQIEALQAQLEVSEKDIEAKGLTIAIMTKKAEDWKAKYDIALAKLKKMEDDDIKEHKELSTLSGRLKAALKALQGQ
jgi:N-acetylmuramoyl-L-alanine amidase CwlA